VPFICRQLDVDGLLSNNSNYARKRTRNLKLEEKNNIEITVITMSRLHL